MKVNIDRENCIGCGACASVCPEVFRLDKIEEKAEVYAQPGVKTPSVMKAVDNCPVAVISIDE